MQAAIESLTVQLSKNVAASQGMGAKSASKAELERVRLEAQESIAREISADYNLRISELQNALDAQRKSTEQLVEDKNHELDAMQKIVSMKDVEISELNTKLALSRCNHRDELAQLDGDDYKAARMDGLGDYKSEASNSGGEGIGSGHIGYSGAGSHSRGNSYAVTPEPLSPRRVPAHGYRLSNASAISQADQFADLVVQD